MSSDFPPERRRVVQELADDLTSILRAASPWGYPPRAEPADDEQEPTP